MKTLLSTLILVCFSINTVIGTCPCYAQGFSVNELPVPGTMVGESAPFAPLALKGLVVNPQKPLEFQFIVDTGRGPQDTASVKDQANQLVKYFLAGLTIPEGDLWVNLSPYEKNRMVPEALGQTDLGRDLLAQDYILKQLTASLIYPEKDLGKEFWSKVYARAQQQFGTTNVPVNTFNKVWILPDQAQVFEHGAAAYVTKATLKVMLDEDYLAKQKHQQTQASSISSQIVREIVIPEISKEVNTGKNFASLRQIYQALILAKWYKGTIQNGLLDAVYTNKNKVAGVNLNDPAVKEQIYERYLKAYKKGAFNYIKEDSTPEGQIVPRKYFSGGITHFGDFAMSHEGKVKDVRADGAMAAINITLKMPDAAMKNRSLSSPEYQGRFYDRFKGDIQHKGLLISLIANDSKILELILNSITKNIKPKDKVLSIGEGQGHLAQALQQRGINIEAIDASKENTKSARAKGVKQTVGDAHHLKFPDKSFDVLIFVESIGALNLQESLKEAFRVLRPGGRILIVTHPVLLPYSPGKMTKEFPYIYYSYEDIKDALQRAGFTKTRASMLGRQFLGLYLITATKGKGNNAQIASKQPSDAAMNTKLNLLKEYLLFEYGRLDVDSKEVSKINGASSYEELMTIIKRLRSESDLPEKVFDMNEALVDKVARGELTKEHLEDLWAMVKRVEGHRVSLEYLNEEIFDAIEAGELTSNGLDLKRSRIWQEKGIDFRPSNLQHMRQISGFSRRAIFYIKNRNVYGTDTEGFLKHKIPKNLTYFVITAKVLEMGEPFSMFVVFDAAMNGHQGDEAVDSRMTSITDTKIIFKGINDIAPIDHPRIIWESKELSDLDFIIGAIDESFTRTALGSLTHVLFENSALYGKYAGCHLSIYIDTDGRPIGRIDFFQHQILPRDWESIKTNANLAKDDVGYLSSLGLRRIKGALHRGGGGFAVFETVASTERPLRLEYQKDDHGGMTTSLWIQIDQLTGDQAMNAMQLPDYVRYVLEAKNNDIPGNEIKAVAAKFVIQNLRNDKDLLQKAYGLLDRWNTEKKSVGNKLLAADIIFASAQEDVILKEKVKQAEENLSNIKFYGYDDDIALIRLKNNIISDPVLLESSLKALLPREFRSIADTIDIFKLKQRPEFEGLLHTNSSDIVRIFNKSKININRKTSNDSYYVYLCLDLVFSLWQQAEDLGLGEIKKEAVAVLNEMGESDFLAPRFLAGVLRHQYRTIIETGQSSIAPSISNTVLRASSQDGRFTAVFIQNMVVAHDRNSEEYFILKPSVFAFSPNGDYLAVVTQDGSVTLLSIKLYRTLMGGNVGSSPQKIKFVKYKGKLSIAVNTSTKFKIFELHTELEDRESLKEVYGGEEKDLEPASYQIYPNQTDSQRLANPAMNAQADEAMSVPTANLEQVPQAPSARLKTLNDAYWLRSLFFRYMQTYQPGNEDYSPYTIASFFAQLMQENLVSYQEFRSLAIFLCQDGYIATYVQLIDEGLRLHWITTDNLDEYLALLKRYNGIRDKAYVEILTSAMRYEINLPKLDRYFQLLADKGEWESYINLLGVAISYKYIKSAEELRPHYVLLRSKMRMKGEGIYLAGISGDFCNSIRRVLENLPLPLEDYLDLNQDLVYMVENKALKSFTVLFKIKEKLWQLLPPDQVREDFNKTLKLIDTSESPWDRKEELLSINLPSNVFLSEEERKSFIASHYQEYDQHHPSRKSEPEIVSDTLTPQEIRSLLDTKQVNNNWGDYLRILKSAYEKKKISADECLGRFLKLDINQRKSIAVEHEVWDWYEDYLSWLMEKEILTDPVQIKKYLNIIKNEGDFINYARGMWWAVQLKRLELDEVQKELGIGDINILKLGQRRTTEELVEKILEKKQLSYQEVEEKFKDDFKDPTFHFNILLEGITNKLIQPEELLNKINYFQGDLDRYLTLVKNGLSAGYWQFDADTVKGQIKEDQGKLSPGFLNHLTLVQEEGLINVQQVEVLKKQAEVFLVQMILLNRSETKEERKIDVEYFRAWIMPAYVNLYAISPLLATQLIDNYFYQRQYLPLLQEIFSFFAYMPMDHVKALNQFYKNTGKRFINQVDFLQELGHFSQGYQILQIEGQFVQVLQTHRSQSRQEIENQLGSRLLTRLAQDIGLSQTVITNKGGDFFKQWDLRFLGALATLRNRWEGRSKAYFTILMQAFLENKAYLLLDPTRYREEDKTFFDKEIDTSDDNYQVGDMVAQIRRHNLYFFKQMQKYKLDISAWLKPQEAVGPVFTDGERQQRRVVDVLDDVQKGKENFEKNVEESPLKTSVKQLMSQWTKAIDQDPKGSMRQLKDLVPDLLPILGNNPGALKLIRALDAVRDYDLNNQPAKENYKIRFWDRNEVGKNIFLGNCAGSCTATGTNASAIFEYILDFGTQYLVIENEGQVEGYVRFWLGIGKDNRPKIFIDSHDGAAQYYYTPMLDQIKKFAEVVGFKPKDIEGAEMKESDGVKIQDKLGGVLTSDYYQHSRLSLHSDEDILGDASLDKWKPKGGWPKDGAMNAQVGSNIRIPVQDLQSLIAELRVHPENNDQVIAKLVRLMESGKPLLVEIGPGDGKWSLSKARAFKDTVFVAIDNGSDNETRTDFNGLNSKATENLVFIKSDAEIALLLFPIHSINYLIMINPVGGIIARNFLAWHSHPEFIGRIRDIFKTKYTILIKPYAEEDIKWLEYQGPFLKLERVPIVNSENPLFDLSGQTYDTLPPQVKTINENWVWKVTLNEAMLGADGAAQDEAMISWRDFKNKVFGFFKKDTLAQNPDAIKKVFEKIESGALTEGRGVWGDVSSKINGVVTYEFSYFGGLPMPQKGDVILTRDGIYYWRSWERWRDAANRIRQYDGFADTHEFVFKDGSRIYVCLDGPVALDNGNLIRKSFERFMYAAYNLGGKSEKKSAILSAHFFGFENEYDADQFNLRMQAQEENENQKNKEQKEKDVVRFLRNAVGERVILNQQISRSFRENFVRIFDTAGRGRLQKDWYQFVTDNVNENDLSTVNIVIYNGRIYNDYNLINQGDLTHKVVHIFKVNDEFKVALIFDSAMNAAPGGIDLNQINVKRTGKTINVQFDQAQLNELEQSDFKGFTPMITGFKYIQSPLPLLGINVSTKEPEVLAKA